MTTYRTKVPLVKALFVKVVGILLVALWSMPGANADRVILAPEGGTLAPQGIKSEFVLDPYQARGNLGWFQFSSTEGIEFEGQRVEDSDRKLRYSFNVQYPLISEFGVAPAISLGVRDLLGTGVERGSVYLAATRSFPLSDRQLKWARQFKISLGAGTGTFGGLFVGVETRLAAGVTLAAEVFRRRPNLSVALPLSRHVQARAYSLDGNVFYGLSYTLAR